MCTCINTSIILSGPHKTEPENKVKPVVVLHHLIPEIIK